ncbi:MAG: hypothetical protein NTZ13_02355 [Candidatus Parcubacteria bacterium]|nr:hypothetical protein [Candidatus Parcubacteria bacterium]
MKNTEIKITKAVTFESQEIRELETLVWEEEVTNKYDVPMFVRFGYVFVAKIGDKIVGAMVTERMRMKSM